MDETVHIAALAGFARGIGDFWPADVSAPGLAQVQLEQAERCVRGAEALPGTPKSLTSLFTVLGLPGVTAPRLEPRYIPCAPLAMQHDVLFPASAAGGDISKLRSAFQQEVRAAVVLGPALLLEVALDAAMRLAWCVPASGYGEQCTVSRFDHARSMAAVAACLGVGDDFTLIGGDLSGIQSFIYTLASSGAAKSLRARSFYVQLLAESIARSVLNQLGLPMTSALYIGGGGFQILAPGKSVENLPAIEADIQRRLLLAHRSALGIVIKAHRFQHDKFDRFTEVREALGHVVNAAKRRPFSAVQPEQLADYVGRGLGTGGDQTNFCRVTGEEVPSSRGASGDDVVKSDFVESLEELGRILPRATHLALAAIPATDPVRVSAWDKALRMFGLAVAIVLPGEPMPQLPGDSPVRLARLSVSESRDSPALKSAFGKRGVVSFYYPFAQLMPTDSHGAPLTFEDLAGKSTGLKRWAVMRLDVDNLGALFRNGFGKKPGLARTAGLSFALRLFFEGWIPQLAAQDESLKKSIYIQYAGGDDVFVVGAWDAIAAYALRIRESFREYTCANPALTLSGGIALADANFPLYQAARMAGDAEDAAKLYSRGGKSKDAISFMDEVLNWADYTAAYRDAQQLAAWCKDGTASRALLQVLQQLYFQTQSERSEQSKAKVKRRYTRATWLAAYQMTRMVDVLTRKPDSAEAVTAVRRMQAELMKPDAQSNVIALAARWAQYSIRG